MTGTWKDQSPRRYLGAASGLMSPSHRHHNHITEQQGRELRRSSGSPP